MPETDAFIKILQERYHNSLFFAALVLAMAGCNRDPQHYFEEGNRQASAGRFADAVENYNQAIILKKGFPEALTSRGLVYEKTRLLTRLQKQRTRRGPANNT